MSDKRDRNLDFYFSTLGTNSISASYIRLLKFTTIQVIPISTMSDKKVGRTKILLKNENSQIALKVSGELENCLAHMEIDIRTYPAQGHAEHPNQMFFFVITNRIRQFLVYSTCL